MSKTSVCANTNDDQTQSLYGMFKINSSVSFPCSLKTGNIVFIEFKLLSGEEKEKGLKFNFS